MSYLERLIEIDLELGTGSFGSGKADKVTLKGLRCSVSIIKAYAPSADQAVLRIYGLSLSIMNQVTTLGKPENYTRNNKVTIRVGDSVNGMSLIFTGIMTDCWADFQGMPEVSFNIQAHTGQLERIRPVDPISFKGGADVATIMAGLATRMEMGFENNGVTAVLMNPYFGGTAKDQAERVAAHAGIDLYFDSSSTPVIMVICPKGQSRTTKQIPLISSATGMIGYPGYNATYITLRTLYNPSIRFGGDVKVESTITPACGIWTINQLNYDLSCETPGGPWFCDLGGYRLGNPSSIPPQ